MKGKTIRDLEVELHYWQFDAEEASYVVKKASDVLAKAQRHYTALVEQRNAVRRQLELAHAKGEGGE